MRVFVRVTEERYPDFRVLEELQQKYYLQDAASGEYACLYLWKSPEAMAEYRNSDLRASIAKAYQVQGEPRVEVYKVAKTLQEDIPQMYDSPEMFLFIQG